MSRNTLVDPLPPSNVSLLHSRYLPPLRAVIPNQGAMKRCQGCCQLLYLQSFIKVLPLRVPQIAIFSQVRMQPIFLNSKGCREPKKVGKHCLRVLRIMRMAPYYILGLGEIVISLSSNIPQPISCTVK